MTEIITDYNQRKITNKLFLKPFIEKVWSPRQFPTYDFLRELEMDLKLSLMSELKIIPVYLDKNINLNCFSLIYEKKY